jgi:DNA-binding response OmpR family regulator
MDAVENGSAQAGDESSGSGSLAGLPASTGERARMQPLRVLVLSTDARFRAVMALLLARHNCSVTTTASASRVTELIRRENPDVAVIDSSGSALSDDLPTLRALARRRGLVLVADEVSAGEHERDVLPKWGPFEELMAEIERADRRSVAQGNGDVGR